MEVIIRKARILDPQSPYHGKKMDIHIEKGKIRSIDKNIKTQIHLEIKGNDLHITGGWMDGFGFYGEPGFEHRETLNSGLEAAAKGGYTDVLATPDTSPTISHAAQIEYLKSSSQRKLTNLHLTGSITKNLQGEDLSEMMDMHHAGAIAFTEGFGSIAHTGLMKRAMEYSLSKNFPIINLPINSFLNQGGQMHEGEYSVKYGMSGIPSIAETLVVHRDIQLAEYTGAKIHIPNISTAGSVDLVKQAKKKGIKVTCGVSPWHLNYTDQDMSDYSSNLKMHIPFRSSSDQKALIKGLKDGTIDVLSSMHCPQNPEAKETEFDHASPGMIGLQTVLPLFLSTRLDIELLPLLLVENIRNILHLPIPTIKTGENACLTVFDPTETWILDQRTNASISKNSVLYGQTLEGKIIATTNNNKLIVNK